MQFIQLISFSPRRPPLPLCRASACLGHAVRLVVFCLAALSVGVANAAYTYTTQILSKTETPGSSASIVGLGAVLNAVSPAPNVYGIAYINYRVNLSGTQLPNRIYYAYDFPSNGHSRGSVNGALFGNICNCTPAGTNSGYGFGSLTNSTFTVDGWLKLWGANSTFNGSGSIAIALRQSNCGFQGLSSNCIDREMKEALHEVFCETHECDSNATTDQVSGAMLTGLQTLDVPVVQENGFTDYVFAHSEPVAPSSNQWIGNPLYVFTSSDIPFTHFGIPEALPGGDGDFQIMFDGMTFPLQANEEFLFTNYVPGGVQKFYLTGFNAAEGLDRTAAAPFQFAVRFGEEGYTELIHGAIAPGNYDLINGVDAADYTIWRSTFGSTTDLRADGNQDGVVDAADYVVWRYWQALNTPAAGSALTSTVPEPSTLVLLATLLAVCALRRTH